MPLMPRGRARRPRFGIAQTAYRTPCSAIETEPAAFPNARSAIASPRPHSALRIPHLKSHHPHSVFRTPQLKTAASHPVPVIRESAPAICSLVQAIPIRSACSTFHTQHSALENQSFAAGSRRYAVRSRDRASCSHLSASRSRSSARRFMGKIRQF